MVHWFESAFDISKIYDLFVLLAWLWIGTSSWFCFVLALHGNYFVLRSLGISLDPPNWGNARCPRFGLFVWPAGHKLKQSTPQISVFNILIALHSRVGSQTRMTNESLATLHFSPINKESIAKTQLLSFRRTKEESLYECLEKHWLNNSAGEFFFPCFDAFVSHDSLRIIDTMSIRDASYRTDFQLSFLVLSSLSRPDFFFAMTNRERRRALKFAAQFSCSSAKNFFGSRERERVRMRGYERHLCTLNLPTSSSPKTWLKILRKELNNKVSIRLKLSSLLEQ